MMVETMLESSQDFGMSNGALPQWKREVLQRRAARSRGCPPLPTAPPPPPPPAPPADDDEELRYGPGIVKRLKSRYLSLALRDAPRRRPSVLRRAASLEHLLDERPPPGPCARPTTHQRPPRPQSMAAPPALLAPAQRRELVKRARSVDALSRLDSREESRVTFSSPPPPPPPPIATRPPQAQPRLARTPRRPTPLLRETERPPPDVVRSTLRKFESAPTRRAAPAARVSAVLRGLEAPRTSTPEPRDPAEPPPLSPREPSPLPPTPTETVPPTGPAAVSASASASVVASFTPATLPTVQDEPLTDGSRPAPGGPRPVSRAALDGIARAGSTMRYVFEAPRAGSHLPPLAATNPVLLGRARRIGVIRPMPARTIETVEEPSVEDIEGKNTERLTSPVPPSSPPPVENEVPPTNRVERREPPPAALVEPIPRTPPEVSRPTTPPRGISPPLIIERSPSPKAKLKPNAVTAPLMNGHAEPLSELKGAISRIGAAGIERAWSGSCDKPAWARGGGRGGRGAPSCTSVVFNFCNRKEVPDYIENDGIVLRAGRRHRIKAGEAGVVVLRPEALVRSDSDSETETDGGPPSPCTVRFINDNVLINGKSSMLGKPNKDRVAKLKLQFDDSLTRTFEYPSETSLCEDAAPPAPPASLAANTHMASAALSSYTPSKTVADSFQLGVTRHENADNKKNNSLSEAEASAEGVAGVAGAGAEADARPCGAHAHHRPAVLVTSLKHIVT